MNLTVLGAGAWGSALASLASHNQHNIRVWSRRSDLSLADAVKDTDVILSAISMKGVAELANRLNTEVKVADSAIIVTATKGLDPATTRTPSQIFSETFPTHPIVVLSGPNLSKEIEKGFPAATVVASTDEAAAEQVQALFASENFRVYTSPDP